jgi:hypothetical protein
MPLINCVASDIVHERVDVDCCNGAVGGMELWLAELGSKTFLL